MDLISKTQKLFFKAPSTPILNTILSHANYYPADISVVKLAKQEKALDHLKLRDFKLYEQLYAQEKLLKRGKPVRVHVIDGPNKNFESTKKSKSKKR